MASHVLLAAIVGISIVLMLIRPRNIPEVFWVAGGAALLLCFRLIPFGLAGRAIYQGLDVYLFLIGMMLLSELAREHGVFDWVSSVAIRAAQRSPSRLFLLVYLVGTIVTIFMSNDATAVVLTPAILASVRKAKVAPLPYLFACAFIANAASFILPISNPANLVVFDKAMPPLGKWLVWFALPSAFSVSATFLILRWLFRTQLREAIETEDAAIELNYDGKLVIGGLAATVIVLLVASALGWNLGWPTCLTGLAVTAIISFRIKRSPGPLFREISWTTIALVAGLFILVDAVESAGGLRLAEQFLAWVETLGLASGAFVAGFVIAIGNNLVNNLPLGLIAGGALRAVHATATLSSAILIGIDLGPNLSITGSLATILWLIALRKEKVDVSFWSFLKIGVVAMPIGLLLSIGAAILIQRIF